MSEAIAFELKSGFNRAEVNVQELDEPYVIESGTHEVKSPALIAALDEHPAVKRVDGGRSSETPDVEHHPDAVAEPKRKGR